MKKLLCILACCLSIVSFANNDYKQAYELLLQQSEEPTDPTIYFKMAEIYYRLSPQQHPIEDYSELKTNLYNITLFYGNCLYYAKDTRLKDEAYQVIPHAGKIPNYDELTAYATPRIAAAKAQRATVDNLYNAYYQLNNRYNLCSGLFAQFCQSYPREKNAHLLLTENDKQQLQFLLEQADSIKSDIAAYQKALEQYPIRNYQPVFRFDKISLYRLDGLTKTNFLQNDIVMWDFADWVRLFITEHEQTYQQYFDAINQEHKKLYEAYTQQRQTPITIDAVLCNRINRFDYQSFLIPFISMEQNAAVAWSASSIEERDIVDPNKIKMVLLSVYEQYKALKQSKEQQQTLKETLTEEELVKYQSLFRQWGFGSVDSIRALATTILASQKQAYQTMENNCIHLLPDFPPFNEYADDISGVVIKEEDITRLDPNLSSEIIAVLPIGAQYMVLTRDLAIRIMDYQNATIQEPMVVTPTDEPLVAAYKLTSNNIALITQSHIYFIDNDGILK